MKRALFVFILLSIFTPANAQLAFEAPGLNPPPGLNIPSVNPPAEQNNLEVPQSFDSLNGGQPPVSGIGDTLIQEGIIPQETEVSQETLLPQTPEANPPQENNTTEETPKINSAQWDNLPAKNSSFGIDFELNQYDQDFNF